jgi:hypothetical protein
MSVTTEAEARLQTREAPPWATEDWLSVGIGLFIFVLALGVLSGTDLLGWAVTTSIWTEPSRALGTLSPVFAPLGAVADIIKMVAYQAESDLLALLRPHYPRRRARGANLAA